jgi:hypothetical protein
VTDGAVTGRAKALFHRETSLRKHLSIILVAAICYENRSERLPRGSNRDKKRKRKLPESRYPRFRVSDATHIESGNLCATSIRAFEVHICSDILDILRMSACSEKASFNAILSTEKLKEIFDGHDKTVFEAMSTAASTKPNKPPRVRYRTNHSNKPTGASPDPRFSVSNLLRKTASR